MAEVNDNSSIQLLKIRKSVLHGMQKRKNGIFDCGCGCGFNRAKDSRSAAKYWSVLKVRLKNEGSELTTNCSQLK